MDYIYTDRNEKCPTRTVVSSAKPLEFSAATGNTSRHASLYLHHNGKRTLIASSGKLQNQYLFLTSGMCQDLYKEAIARIRQEEHMPNHIIDVDEILFRVIRQHEKQLAKKAIRVELHFPEKNAYKNECDKYGVAVIRDRQLMARYREEKQLLMQLIQKSSAVKGRTPEEVILQAITGLSHARFMSGDPCTARNDQQFKEWLRELFEEEDLAAFIQWCSRPDLLCNNHLYNMLYILIHNCPAYQTVFVPA